MSTGIRWDVYRKARDLYRQHIFARVMQKLRQDPVGSLERHPDLLDQLVYGWDNEAWSADRDYLGICIDKALELPGPFLECGSGLSTILLGAIAKSQGKRIWSLEHSPEWMQRVQKCLTKHSIDSVTLCLSPLRRYSGFDWYDPVLPDMPRDFDLVICDGPPGDTDGGRLGLLPVMRTFLEDGCLILLDDAHRPAEKEVLRRWQSEYGVEAVPGTEEQKFAILRLPSRERTGSQP